MNTISEKKSGLSKLAALFTCTFVISLGICGYSAHTGEEFGGDLGLFSLIGMVVSFVCLLATGAAAIFRAVRDGYYN